MKLSSSSTSSSDARSSSDGHGVRVAIYTVAWLILLDVGIGLATRLPADPRVQPSKLQSYFDYGRSVESKLRRMMGPTREQSAPLTLAGWLDLEVAVGDAPTRASQPDHVLVAAYGQSFTGNLVTALSSIDPRFEVRMGGGPAAPPSHSFALYELDRAQHDAKIVILGVLASSLPRVTSLTNMTLWFEGPAPCTYPRYSLEGDKLVRFDSSVRSFEDLSAALADPARLQKLKEELASHDVAYDPFIFDQDLLDFSSLGRVTRRAIGQKHTREVNAQFMDAQGFTNSERMLDVSNAILSQFAASVRKDGRVPFVLLIHDQGYSDFLVRALGPALERQGIGYFSTHELASPKQPRLFLPDGHFRPEVDELLAKGLAAALHKELARVRE